MTALTTTDKNELIHEPMLIIPHLFSPKEQPDFS